MAGINSSSSRQAPGHPEGISEAERAERYLGWHAEAGDTTHTTPAGLDWTSMPSLGRQIQVRNNLGGGGCSGTLC